jgi:hypothetical protein
MRKLKVVEVSWTASGCAPIARHATSPIHRIGLVEKLRQSSHVSGSMRMDETPLFLLFPRRRITKRALPDFDYLNKELHKKGVTSTSP